MYKRKLYNYTIGRGSKRLYLRDVDMQMLCCINDLSYLTTVQIQALYSSLTGKEIQYRQIKTKLDNYSAYGGLLTHKLASQRNFKQSYYSISKQAVEFLTQNGYLDSDTNLSIHKKKAFNVLDVLAREVLVRTFSTLSKRKGYETSFSMFGECDFSSFYNQEGLEFGNNKWGFIPDQLISFGSKKVFIEFDMITAHISDIASKLNKYLAYAKENPSSEIAVVFTTVDNTTSNKVIDKKPFLRLSRILFAMLEYKKQVRELENLNIFVTSLSDSGEVIADYLLDEYEVDRSLIEEKVLQQFKDREADDSNWRYAYLDKKLALYDQKLDGGIRRINRTDNRVYRDFLFIYGHENNLNTIARIDDVINSRSPEAENQKIPLVVIYPPRDKHRDILLMDKYDDTYLLHTSNMKIDLLTDEYINAERADHVVPTSRSVVEIY